MQKLGQHFLKNDSVVKKIVTALELGAGDAVIEIGPGHGELTEPLLNACAAAGISLTAIEKDARLADALREKFSNKELYTKIEILQGDALAILTQTIIKIKSDPAVKKIKLVGNLPYYITGKLLRIISELESDQIPERCVFMIQREVAERIIAAPPAMNRLAASVQFWANAKIVVQVSRTDFSPPPKIDSAVIALTTKIIDPNTQEVTPALYYKAVRAIFAQPRKTLLNNIAATSESKTQTGAVKEEIIARLKKIGVNPEARPQNLDIQNIVSLAKIL
jgi:16S rRNA (adenine1518-N6/adenine1519-N6)-dimethyltransferase